MLSPVTLSRHDVTVTCDALHATLGLVFPDVSSRFQKLPEASTMFRTLPYVSMDFYEFPHASRTFLNLPHVSGTFSYVLIDPMFPLMDYSSHGLLSMVLIMAQSLHHNDVIAQSACGYAPPPLMYINTQVDTPAPQFGLLVTGTGKPPCGCSR